MNYTKKKYYIFDAGLYSILLVGYILLTFNLFYKQALGFEGKYFSDMFPYILEMQGQYSGYSFPYPVMFKFGAFFLKFTNNPQLSIALALTFLNALTPVILKFQLQKQLEKIGYIHEKEERDKFRIVQIVNLLSFGLLFVSMIYLPIDISSMGIKYNYVGVFSPNPFHNATYIATRPFAILAFFSCAEVLNEYESGTSIKKMLWFSFTLFMTTMTKPSFTFVLVPTVGMILLHRFIKSRGKNLVNSIKMGLCFIPTFIVLLYQFFGVFSSNGQEEKGIGLGLATAWKIHCSNIPLAIVLALAFPLIVLLFQNKRIKSNTLFRFSWQILLVGFAENLLLYEKGFRLQDMNFSWGYMHGISFVFITSVLLVLGKTLNLVYERENTNAFCLVFLWSIFGIHLLCGVIYFGNIYTGGLYF